MVIFLNLIIAVVGLLIPSFYFLKRCSQDFTNFEFLGLIFSPWVLHIFIQSLFLTLSTLVVIAMLSLLTAFLIHHMFMKKVFLKKLIETFLSFYWLLPSLFFVMLTWFLMRHLGLQSWLYSLRAVQVAWVLGFTPYVTLGVLKMLSDIDVREVEAAATLGARTFTLCRTIYWPRLKNAFFSFSLQTLWLMLTSFSVVVILGGGSPHDTLETAIYQSVRFEDVHLDRAFAFAFWQGMLMTVLTILRKAFFKKNIVGLEWTRPAHAIHFSKIAAVIIAVLVFLWLRNESSLSDLALPWFQSILIAITVSLTTLTVAAILYRGWRPLAEFGAFISPMMLGLIWWESYGLSNSDFSWELCIGAQTFLFLPWVSRTLFPLLDRKRKFELEAATTLGATSFQAWRTVEWPRIAPEVKRMGAWIMGLSISEVSTVILFSKGKFEPLSVWSQNQFSRFRMEEGWSGVKILILTLALIMLLPEFRNQRGVKNASL